MLRVLQLTDTHLLADRAALLAGEAPDAGLARVINTIAETESGVDMVIVTGDLTDDGSEAGYRRLGRYLEPLAPRIRVIPGNHDDPPLMARFYVQGSMRWTTSELIGGWHLVMLNTACSQETAGRVGEEQLAELDALLSRYPGRPTLVGLHHQPIAVGAPWLDRIGLIDGDALRRCLARYTHVRALVWGHVHQSFDDWDNGMRLLATPATSIQFRPASSEFSVDDRGPGYRRLELGSDGALHTEVVRVA